MNSQKHSQYITVAFSLIEKPGACEAKISLDNILYAQKTYRSQCGKGRAGITYSSNGNGSTGRIIRKSPITFVARLSANALVSTARDIFSSVKLTPTRCEARAAVMMATVVVERKEFEPIQPTCEMEQYHKVWSKACS